MLNATIEVFIHSSIKQVSSPPIKMNMTVVIPNLVYLLRRINIRDFRYVFGFGSVVSSPYRTSHDLIPSQSMICQFFFFTISLRVNIKTIYEGTFYVFEVFSNTVASA